MHRRELLASFLSAPALFAAGCGAAPRLPPAGEILGADVSSGHRLRTPAPVDLPSQKWRSVQVVIVGAGVAGLAAAWRLQHAGIKDVLLLELESQIGGTARSGTSHIVSFPWGAHYVPVPLPGNRLLWRLLAEMGLTEVDSKSSQTVVAEQHLCRDPEERIFYQGKWHPGLYLHEGASQSDLDQWSAFKSAVDTWAAWRDSSNRPAFTIPQANCSDDPHVTALDQISMADWLRQQGWDSSRLWWHVDYACRDDYGLTAEQTSAWAGLFYFVARLSHPGSEHQPLMTWPEGNGRFVKHLHSTISNNSRTRQIVLDIAPSLPASSPTTPHAKPPQAPHSVEIRALDLNSNSPVGYRAQHCIFAAPQFLAPHIIRGLTDDPARHPSDFQYGSWLVANLHLSARPRSTGFPPCWDNVLYESPSLGYVTATHQLGIDHGPTILTYYYPLTDPSPRAARQRLLDLTWQQTADIVLTDLETAHPEIRDLTTRLDVMRWGHAMIRPTPGFIWGNSRKAASHLFRGIEFAHTDLSGIPLFEEALYHGVRAAENILTEQKHPFESFL